MISRLKRWLWVILHSNEALVWKLNPLQHFFLLLSLKRTLFSSAQHKLTICSVIEESPFHMDHFMKQKNRVEAISGHIMRFYPFDSCVILCGFHDNWVRPPIKPTSAVISSPKSFVIALICILQLSALAHSKNNQPPLKTGASIIIISVDLYKTLLTSHCLTSALCCRASFIPYFRKIYTYIVDGDG